jgi:hypothetical protein
MSAAGFDTDRLSKLGQVIEWSRKRLEPFRVNRLSFLREYVGAHYAWEGERERVPLNMMQLAASIYTERLASRSPRVLVTTHKQQLKPSALELETGVSYLVEKIRLRKTLRSAVKEGLFGLGVVKIGITGIPGGFEHDAGQPYVDIVDLDDWVHDMDARTFEEAQFMGNRYWANIDDIRDNPEFDKDARESVKPALQTQSNEQGDLKAQVLSQGQANSAFENFYPKAELWDLWLPKEKIVVTVCADNLSAVNTASKVLRVVEWEGPEHGPYHILSYDQVPNNAMPVPPAAHWMDLHTAINVMARKLIRQGERQKTVTGYQRNSADDAARVKDAADGEVIAMDNPDGVKEFKSGGIDQANAAFVTTLKQFFTYLAGNLDMLGGLSPQSATVGQDRLLSENASQKITDMQDSTINFTSGVVRDLAWWLMTDPTIDIPLTKRITGGMSIPFQLTQEQIEGDFLDYNFEVEPFSMTRKTPSERIQAIQQVFQNFLSPMMPMMQQQGTEIDVQALMQILGRYADMPELNDFIKYSAPSSGPSQQSPALGAPPPPKMAPNTTRTHYRVNVPGGTAGGQDAAMIAHYMGQSKQPAEEARAFAGSM